MIGFMKPAEYAKAIIAGLVALATVFFGTLLTAMGDGHVTAIEWITVASAVVVATPTAFGAVWATTNASLPSKTDAA